MEAAYSVRPRGRDNLHRRQTSDRPPFVRHRDEWTSHGVHYSIDSASFSSPNMFFAAASGAARGPPRSSTWEGQPTVQDHARSHLTASGRFIGAAFNMFGNFLSTRQEPMLAEMAQGRSKRRPQVDRGNEDDGLAYGDGVTDHPARRSLYSKVKDKLLDNRAGEAAFDREQSPVPRLRSECQRSSYKTERPSDWTSRRERSFQVEQDEDSESTSYRHSSRRLHEKDKKDASLTQALERLIDSKLQAIEGCLLNFERASRDPDINPQYLQDLVNEWKKHKESLKLSLSDLEEAREGQEAGEDLGETARQPTQSNIPPQHGRGESRKYRSDPEHEYSESQNNRNKTDSWQEAPRQPGSSRRRRHTARDEDFYQDPFFGFFPQHRNVDPFARAFAGIYAASELHHRFVDHAFRGHHRFFEGPGDDWDENIFQVLYENADGSSARWRPRPSRAPPGTHPYTRNPGSAPPRARPPPASAVKPEEAKALFANYTERWASLTPDDPNIVFPARGLSALSFLSRDSIYAPDVKAPTSAWSEEDVMKANAQAFFLGAVGLKPYYTESRSNGRLQMGFDKRKALPEQVKNLIDILKKEKTRWHSDRLGRRNGGAATGPNEALQTDERARAVFHAVCELMEFAQ